MPNIPKSSNSKYSNFKHRIKSTEINKDYIHHIFPSCLFICVLDIILGNRIK